MTDRQVSHTPELLTKLVEPVLMRSSHALDWRDIEVQTYLEPDAMEGWGEPVSPDISIVLVTQGRVHLTQADCDSCKGYPIQQGDLMLMPAATVVPELRWRSLSQEAVQTLRLKVSQALFYGVAESAVDGDPAHIQLAGIPRFQDPLLMQVCLALKREMESPSPDSALYVQSATQLLVAHLLRHYAQEPVAMPEAAKGLSARQLRRITDYIQAYISTPLSLDDLARQIGFSPYHFAHIFRQVTGETPHQFVLRQRVEYAKRLLHNQDLSLTQVAMESGFAHQSHLTHIFKRHTGITPHEFRKQYTIRARI